jgi:hypothetical protein
MEISLQASRRKLQAFQWIMENNDLRSLTKDLMADSSITPPSAATVIGNMSAEAVFLWLHDLSTSNKIQMFDIEWKVLPVFYGKITIITNRSALVYERHE